MSYFRHTSSSFFLHLCCLHCLTFISAIIYVISLLLLFQSLIFDQSLFFSFFFLLYLPWFDPVHFLEGSLAPPDHVGGVDDLLTFFYLFFLNFILYSACPGMCLACLSPPPPLKLYFPGIHVHLFLQPVHCFHYSYVTWTL